MLSLNLQSNCLICEPFQCPIKAKCFWVRGPLIRLVHSTGPQLHFFCCEMSSLARNKAVRDTLATRIARCKSTDDDVAEVLPAKDRPASRIGLIPVTQIASPCLLEGIRCNHPTCGWPSGRCPITDSVCFCYWQVRRSAVATARLSLARSPRCGRCAGLFPCGRHGHVVRGPTD